MGNGLDLCDHFWGFTLAAPDPRDHSAGPLRLAGRGGRTDPLDRALGGCAPPAVSVRGWLDEGLPAVRVSVNVSPRQLQGQNLLSEVLGALTSAGIPPALLGIEITESSLMAENLAVVETLRAIHRTGVTLSVDDFGTGYSSLSYLVRFPLDALKLDRAFVQGVTSEADKRAITEAVLAMARGLELRVVAEGVETEEQLRFLRERGCPLAQGYLFAEPLPEDAFRKLLRERHES